MAQTSEESVQHSCNIIYYYYISLMSHRSAVPQQCHSSTALLVEMSPKTKDIGEKIKRKYFLLDLVFAVAECLS